MEIMTTKRCCLLSIDRSSCFDYEQYIWQNTDFGVLNGMHMSARSVTLPLALYVFGGVDASYVGSILKPWRAERSCQRLKFHKMGSSGS